MEILYAPWRAGYSGTIAQTKKEETSEHDCIFCQQQRSDDDQKNLILRRFGRTLVMLNLYPYNAGHLLVLPLAHIPQPNGLPKETRAELMELISYSIVILQKVLRAEGINVGLNLGRVSGAGIPSHLHMHVLPRFTGDTNFLPLIAQTKQISFDLNEIYKKLKPSFDELTL